MFTTEPQASQQRLGTSSCSSLDAMATLPARTRPPSARSCLVRMLIVLRGRWSRLFSDDGFCCSGYDFCGGTHPIYTSSSSRCGRVSKNDSHIEPCQSLCYLPSIPTLNSDHGAVFRQRTSQVGHTERPTPPNRQCQVDKRGLRDHPPADQQDAPVSTRQKTLPGPSLNQPRFSQESAVLRSVTHAGVYTSFATAVSPCATVLL